MVSISNIVTGAIILGGISAFAGLGGFKGIGSKIGAGFGDFGTSLVKSFTGSFPEQGQKDTIQNVVEKTGLGDYVTNIPIEERPMTAKEKGLMTIAGFVQNEGIGGTINLETGVFTNKVTKQPLGFTINSSGGVKTGTVGLGSSTLAAQAALSKKYGIPTFDVKGNISTFGGITSGGGHSGGSSGLSHGQVSSPSFRAESRNL